MYIPPAEHPSGWLCLVAFIFRRGRSLLILIGKVFQCLRLENKQKEVPRFFYIYTNGAFGADFPRTTSNEKTIYCSSNFCHKGRNGYYVRIRSKTHCTQR